MEDAGFEIDEDPMVMNVKYEEEGEKGEKGKGKKKKSCWKIKFGS